MEAHRFSATSALTAGLRPKAGSAGRILLLSSPWAAFWPCAYLWDVMAEAVPPVAVWAELAQGCDAGFAAGEAAGVVSFNGSRNQSVYIFLRCTVCCGFSCCFS